MAQRPALRRVALLGLATLAQLTYREARADTLFTSLLADEGTTPDAIAATARLRLAIADRTRGDFREARDALVEVRREASMVGDSVLDTEALLLLATGEARLSGPQAAEALFEEAAGRLSTPYLAALYHCGRAEMLVLSGRPVSNEARRGAALAGEAGDRRLEAACLSSHASDLARQGDTEGAIREMARVVDLRSQLRDLSGLANALQWKGYMLRTLGWLDESRKDLEAAVAAGRISRNTSAQAWAYDNLAYIDLTLGDPADGAIHADSAQILFAVQGDRYGQASLASVTAEVALAAGDLDTAEEAYRASLALLQPLGFTTGVITTHIGLAHIAMARRDWSEAQRQLEAARAAAAASGMVGRLYGLSYHRAVLALRRGKLDQAEAELLPALKRVETSWREDPAGGQPDWAYQYRMRLAEIRARKGDLDGAQRLADEALDALEAWRATLSRRQLRMLAFQASEDRSDPDLGFATIVADLAGAGRIGEAFALAERMRARDLEDQLARIDALGAADTANDVRPRLIKLTDPARVEAATPDQGTALLHFVTGRNDEPTTLFVLGRFGQHAYVLPTGDSLEVLARRLDAVVRSGEGSVQLASVLGEELLGRAVADMPSSVRHLVVVPDGPLHLIPWDALRLPHGSFVVDRFTVALEPSSSLAAEDWAAPGHIARASVLAVGDPDLQGVQGASFLPPLSGAEAEARRAARYGVGSRALLGVHATEQQVRRLASRPWAILHLATHARTDEGSFSGTELLLAAGGGEDGLLGPGEIARMRLPADLVILSSCSSAAGIVIRGEGVAGLAAAFRQAGARAIVLTRWPVDDRTTGRMVDALYRGLADGLTVADAVRTAQLDMKKRGAPASVWATLTLVGDPGLRLDLRRPFPVAYLAGGLAVLLLVSVAVGLERRRRSRTVARANGPAS